MLTTVVASKVRFTRQSKVGFQSRISKSASRDNQSRLRFSSRILKSAPRGTKSTSVFKSHFKSPHCGYPKSTSVTSKVRFDGMATSQAPRLDAKLLFRISPARELHSNYYSRITSAGFAHSQARRLCTNNYSTWLIRLSYLEDYTLQEYSDDGFREH
jgi:hypothetical protein